MTARVAELAAAGPPWAFPCPNGVAACKELAEENCAQQDRTGFLEPTRTSLPPLPPPPPPPAPGPPGGDPCKAALHAHCDREKFPDYEKCLACSRAHANSPTCSPRQRQHYCNGTSPDW